MAAGMFCPLLIGGVRFSQLSEHDALPGMDVVGIMDFLPPPFHGGRGEIEFLASRVMRGDISRSEIPIGQIQRKNTTVDISVVGIGRIDSLPSFQPPVAVLKAVKRGLKQD